MKPIMLLGDLATIGGLIAVQFFYAGTSVLMGYLMSLGISAFVIVIFSTLATFLLLSPFAVSFERLDIKNNNFFSPFLVSQLSEIS